MNSVVTQEDTFTALYQQHRAALTRRVRYLVHDPDAVEDTLQDTWEKALRAWPESPGDARLSWLSRIAHNTAIDTRRRNAVHAPIGEPLFHLQDNGQEEERGDVLAVEPERDVLLDKWRAFMRLSEVDRCCLLLHAAGYSYQEIAEMVCAETGDEPTMFSVRSRCHRARVRLRAWLDMAEERELA